METSRLGPYEITSTRVVGDLVRSRATAPDGQVVELVHAFPGADPRAVAAEEAAGWATAAVEHRHVSPVVDLFHTAEGRLVVVQPPAEVGLDAWLADRGALEAGEAVTILLPILDAVAAATRAGVIIDRLDPADVVIDAEGAPVLARVRPRADAPPTTSEHAVAAEPGRKTSASVARAFAEDVASRLEPSSPSLAPALGLLPSAAGIDDLVEVVHDLAPARPLPTTTGLRARPVGPVRPDGAEPVDRPAWLALLPESAVLDGLLGWWSDRSRMSATARLTTVRPRYWALAAIVAASVGVAVVALPGGASRGGEADPGTAAAPPTARELPPAPAAQGPSPTAGSGAGEVAVDERDAPGAEADAAEGEGAHRKPVEGVLRGDDVLAAARVLVEARNACLREPAPSCLAATTQPGSPLAGRDAQLLADPSVVTGEPTPLVVVAELQRLGDTVLLDATGPDDRPASVLMVRTEAGWRVRDVVARR